MTTATRKMIQGDPQEWTEFEALLSGFLSAAASVPNVLRAENRRLCQRVCEVFVDRLEQADLELLGWLDDLRGDEVHVIGAEVEQTTGTIPITQAVRGPQAEIYTSARVGLYAFDAPAVPEIGVLAPQIKDPSGNTVDVIPACQKCLELLEALVVAAEQEAATTPVPAR